MESSADLHSRQQLLRLALTRAPALLRFLQRQVREVSEAQDLLQELYVRILRLKSLDAIRSPQAYLFRVAANLAWEHRRRGQERPRHVALDEALEELVGEGRVGGTGTPETNAPEEAAVLAQRLEALRRRLTELSPRIQAAVLWHHRDGYTCDEIGEKLSVVTHRVKKYLAKGLAHCRREPLDARTDVQCAG